MKIPKEDIFNIIVGRTSIMVSRVLLRNFRKHRLDITMEQWSILAILWQKDGCTQQELGNKTYREKAGVTRLLDKLEQQNIINRVTDAHDRRVRFIYLTERGRALEEKANQIVVETYQQAIRDISEEDRTVCKNVLNKIYDNLREIP